MVDPVVQSYLEHPIGRRDLQKYATPGGHIFHPEALEAGRRAQKKWLPEGKRSAVSAEAKQVDAALRSTQIDLEEAIEAAGGARGSLRSQ